MSENENTPTPPDAPVPDGVMKSVREFSGALTLDLTDDEIARAFRVVKRVKSKHEEIFRRKFPFNNLDDALDLVEEFEDELKTTLAEQCNILASVDTTPILEGQPVQIEWIGKLPGDGLYKYGMDHEKKTWEVQKATERGENYLGEHDN